MRLIIVGSLEGQLTTASRIALNNGAKVIHAPDEATALSLIRAKGADLLMIDVKCNIKGLLDQLASEHISTPAVACGVGSNSDEAVAAIRAGAKEYIPLPPDPDLIAAILTAISVDDHEFIYRDRNMIQVVKLANQIAASEASIIITGDSGTGKEVMARYVHNKSRRNNKAFIAVNCAAIPENLLESELFGHEKGAFTGAIARRVGKFEEANGGTLLLDEISEMDVRLQAKLLRVIQERELDRVGGSSTVKINIRIIATTNCNLQEEVKNGRFREDLLFRLNVVNLNIPPLRDRPEDIRVLCKHFAVKYAEFNGLPYKNVSDSAMKILINHQWPGNVRELENTIHRAVLLTVGENIGASDIVLPDGRPHIEIQSSGAAMKNMGIPEGAEPLAAASLIGRTVADVEKDLIIDTLKHCLGNRTHAANILGISIRTLRNKLNLYMSDGVNIPGPGMPLTPDL
ncbi:MAG: sigma-54-dependent Fis family transcriptional regulator [Alphaproteobacteria bacterium]|nr:sigma-54-dependent Fis family transcriptional regulator [Alphaproteobacteria bacterium]